MQVLRPRALARIAGGRRLPCGSRQLHCPRSATNDEMPLLNQRGENLSELGGTSDEVLLAQNQPLEALDKVLVVQNHASGALDGTGTSMLVLEKQV